MSAEEAARVQVGEDDVQAVGLRVELIGVDATGLTRRNRGPGREGESLIPNHGDQLPATQIRRLSTLVTELDVLVTLCAGFESIEEDRGDFWCVRLRNDRTFVPDSGDER